MQWREALLFQGVFAPLPPASQWEGVCGDLVEFVPQTQSCAQAANLVANSAFVHACNLHAARRYWDRPASETAGQRVHAGFSVGIYAALVVAGHLDVARSFEIVVNRAKALEAAAGDSWELYALAGAHVDRVTELCHGLSGRVFVSSISSPQHCSLAVRRDARQEVATAVRGVNCISFRPVLRGAWHTPVVRPALPTVAALLESLKSAMVPDNVIFNQPTHEMRSLREALLVDCVNTVDWRATLLNLRSESVVIFDGSDTLWKTLRANGITPARSGA